MHVKKSKTGVQSGYHVGAPLYERRWHTQLSIPSATDWMLADASTPSPNRRGSELLLHLICAFHYPNKRIVSFVGMGGTFQEYAHLWGGEQDESGLASWKLFYESHMRNFSSVPQGFSPASTIVGVLEKRRELISCAANALGIVLDPVVLNLEKEYNTMIGKISWYGDSALGKLPCPDCSYQKGEIQYHPVRKGTSGLYLSRNERSVSPIKCRGAKAFSAANVASMTILDLVQATGFRLSGKLVYKLLCERDDGSALLVRDYSTSRGIAEFIVGAYKTNQLMFTHALNIVRDGRDATGFELLDAINSDPASFLTLISEFNIQSSGEATEITLD